MDDEAWSGEERREQRMREQMSDRDVSHGDASRGDASPRLVHLADARELRVAQGDPDIRGWDVRTAEGEKIGTVKDLIIDTQLMKVRYIEARIDREVLNAADHRYVLIPIGSAQLDEQKDDVFLDPAVVDPRALPPYDRSPLTREYELFLRERFPCMRNVVARASDAIADTERRGKADDEFYRDALYDDARFFGDRRSERENASYLSPHDDDDERRNAPP